MNDITNIFSNILYEFPISQINFKFPAWVNGLDLNHSLRQELLNEIKDAFSDASILKDINQCAQKINQTETESKAEAFFIKAVNSKTYDNNMISALNLYRMLAEAYPENVIYPLKVGKLYDVIGKDRYAKGYYYRAMNIDKSNPEPYYHLGDFFYKREHYRKALKFYKKSYDRGKNQAKEKINAINAKLDDNSRI